MVAPILLLSVGAGADSKSTSPDAGSAANANTPPPPLDMNAWESQTLGVVFGGFCGYYPDRLTLLGQAEHLRSYAECKELFERFSQKCVSDLKAKGDYKVNSPEQGRELGGKVGSCIGAAFDDRLKATSVAAPPDAGPTRTPGKGSK